MHMVENPSLPTPKILPLNNVSVIQIFVFTIVFCILFINNNKIKISKIFNVWCFCNFKPKPLLTLNSKAWIILFENFTNQGAVLEQVYDTITNTFCCSP